MSGTGLRVWGAAGAFAALLDALPLDRIEDLRDLQSRAVWAESADSLSDRERALAVELRDQALKRLIEDHGTVLRDAAGLAETAGAR